ncbi:MAG TPA: hypothetical protein VMV52_10065, partial [Candidatus Nanopelagicaceae bacterium]|nr:hypothetical protein [Candidatus Nanopelagicaceae bacterium]
MFARPIQFVAVVLVAASSISTAAYATDSSPAPTPSTSTSSSATAGVSNDQVSNPVVSDPAAGQVTPSPIADTTPLATRASIDQVSGSTSMIDSNLRASIVTTALPSLSITSRD